jgi:asparagine synthase (glutamine-hydrolysing)
MCGIAGILSISGYGIVIEKRQLLDSQLFHRGPDGGGFWEEEGALMVHRRLSIIDISQNGLQPFFSNDNNVVSIVNGEIYNFQELRKKLVGKGYRFKSNSDSEVVPHLYQEYGIEFVQQIRGMFAIAIYDRKLKKLWLVRDRFGIKPLYYHLSPDYFYFGSELKAILCHPEVRKEIDWQAIYDYLSLCYVPEPMTGFLGIQALEPGCYLEVSALGANKIRYWDINQLHVQNIEFQNARDTIKELIKNSIAAQKVSDVPLGAFLSGGLDSATVVTTLSQLNGVQPKTFTVKFPDKDFDESPYAREIARINRTEHHELNIPEGDGDPNLFEKLLQHFDQPFGDSSAIPTYLISKKIREHVKVALSGDGGDEILGGYAIFWYFAYIKQLSALPKAFRYIASGMIQLMSLASPNTSRQLRKALRLSQLNDKDLLCHLSSYLSEKDKEELFNPEFLKELRRSGLRSSNHCFEDFEMTNNMDDKALNISKMLFRSSLPSDMFKKVDMMSMLAGIEVRVPLLDEDLASFALCLPEGFKIKKRKGKYILRELLKEKLPDYIVNKKKSGFAIPLDKLVNQPMMNFIQEHLTGKGSRVSTFTNKELIKDWISAFEGKKTLHSNISREGVYQRIFMLLSLEIWLKKYDLHPTA